MGVTLRQIEAELRRASVKYKRLDGKTLATGFKLEHTSLALAILLDENGQRVMLRSVHLIKAPKDHPNVDSVLTYLCRVNEERSLVKFAWDHRDGEIVLSADLPIEEAAEFDGVQLHGLVLALTTTWNEVYPEVNRLLGARATGALTQPTTGAIVPPRQHSPFALGFTLLGVAAVLWVVCN